jgi:hypothetical protein
MRKNIRQAFQSLVSGKVFRTKNGSLSVRDNVAYSYQMPIAWLVNGNQVDVTSEKPPTKTTTQHVNGFKVLANW